MKKILGHFGQSKTKSCAKRNISIWNLWQKAPGESLGQPFRFLNLGYRGSEACYTPTKKKKKKK